MIVTYHADVLRSPAASRVYRVLLKRVLDSCDRIVVSTRAFAQSSPVVEPILARSPERIAVIPLGVDLERFIPGDTERSLGFRAAWGGGPVVLFVGRLRHYKGLLDLVAAVKDTDLTLVVVGNGPERHRLLRAAKELGDRFFWMGPVTEEILPDIYRAAHVFCLPSSSAAETFGLATVEALASGLPAVTTEVGTGTSFVNIDGVTGTIVPPSDPMALRSALQEIVDDDVLRKTMGVEARRRAEVEFRREQMLDRVQALYESLA
jgi:rhamnosyl/mannosyltransferase